MTMINHQKQNGFLYLSLFLLISFILVSCSQNLEIPKYPVETSQLTTSVTPTLTQAPTPTQTPYHASIPPNLGELSTYQIINQYPHDPKAFTQGLVFHEGYLFESTGLYGQSSLRKVALESGEVLQQVSIDPAYFAEGLALWENSLIQLSWKESIGWVYEAATFEKLAAFTYPGEGWGLTHDGKHLIMSDGSHQIRFLDPQTFDEVGRINVLENGLPVLRLNELEYIQGEIYANIWQTDTILRINPTDGTILGKINLEGLLPRETLTELADVLNGIAYDSQANRLFVTGKLWPYLYEILLVDQIAND